MVDPKDVEERLAIRLEGDPRACRVIYGAAGSFAGEPPVVMWVRVFVECERFSSGWRSMYVHELSDVDRFLDGARR